MNEPTHSDAPARIDLANAHLLLSTPPRVRKVRDFGRPVERAVLLECLRLAVQAPTASNRQTWRWVIVTEPELKAKIADWYREAALPYLRESHATAAAGAVAKGGRNFD